MKNKVLNNERSLKFVSNPGSPLKEKFHGKVMDSGEIVLVSDGFDNLQDYIESFAEETKIENIINRVNNGEIDLLNAATGAYIDSVGMPKTYAEILQTVIDGQKVFERLPVDIKEKFGNDFNVWFSQIDDPDFMVKTGLLKEVEKKDIDEENKE